MTIGAIAPGPACARSHAERAANRTIAAAATRQPKPGAVAGRASRATSQPPASARARA